MPVFTGSFVAATIIDNTVHVYNRNGHHLRNTQQNRLGGFHFQKKEKNFPNVSQQKLFGSKIYSTGNFFTQTDLVTGSKWVQQMVHMNLFYLQKLKLGRIITLTILGKRKTQFSFTIKNLRLFPAFPLTCFFMNQSSIPWLPGFPEKVAAPYTLQTDQWHQSKRNALQNVAMYTVHSTDRHTMIKRKRVAK